MNEYDQAEAVRERDRLRSEDLVAQLERSCVDEFNILVMGHIASGKTTFAQGIERYLGYDQLRSLNKGSRISMTQLIVGSEALEEEDEKRVSQRAKMGFKGRIGSSHIIETKPLYFQNGPGTVSKVNLIVQSGNCATDKLSRESSNDERFAGVIYMVNNVVLSSSESFLSGELHESSEAIAQSVREDKRDAERLFGKGIPFVQVTIPALYDSRFDANIEGCDQRMELENLRFGVFDYMDEDGYPVDHGLRSDHMAQSHRIMKSFVNLEMDKPGKFISIARDRDPNTNRRVERAGTVHYKAALV